MANPEHLAKLKEGVEDWNNWRKDNPKIWSYPNWYAAFAWSYGRHSILLNTFVYLLQRLTGNRILGLSKEAIISESRSPDLFFSFSFWSSLTIWIYIHIFYHKFSIEKFLFSTCQLTPISIKPELAPQQPITLRPFICWFISEDYILYHSFQVGLNTINRICDRFGWQVRETYFF